MPIGYAHVSTQEQDPTLQLNALTQARCDKVITEKASGAQRGRPQLMALLEYMCEGDTLCVEVGSVGSISSAVDRNCRTVGKARNQLSVVD